VSILYRTHKSLPATSKISSLYVFDALARAARHKVEKQGLVNDSQIGNCATFLQKVEGVVEGLFQDMLSIGSPEAKVSKTYRFQRILSRLTSSPSYPCPFWGDLGLPCFSLSKKL
jgi:hypothetical protein